MSGFFIFFLKEEVLAALGSSDCNVLMTKLENSFFTIDLSSNASLDCYPDNTLASFRTSLSAPLELDDNQWTVSSLA